MASEKIEREDGTPLAEGDGVALQSVEIADALPTEKHGFSIDFRLGPYPIDAPRSQRRAMYVFLKPISQKAQKAMKWIGRDQIIGSVPLTEQGALDVMADDRVKEGVCRMVLGPALELAKQVDES